MAGLVGEYPDLDILVNAAENGSHLRKSNKGGDIEGAFDPEEYAHLVQQCTEKSQSVQQRYNLEYQKQKLAKENEAALLEALQQSLTKIESDHFSDFVNLSSSLEHSTGTEVLPSRTTSGQKEDSSGEEDSVLKKLLLSSSNDEYSRSRDSPCDGNNNIFIPPKKKETPGVFVKQEKNKAKMTKKKPFTELLKHLEGSQSKLDVKPPPNLDSQTNQAKKVGTRLVNTVRYMRKYNSVSVTNGCASAGKVIKVKTESPSSEKIPVQNTIFPPKNLIKISPSQPLKRSASFQSCSSPKVAKIVVTTTNCHAKSAVNDNSSMCSKIALSSQMKPVKNQSSVTSIAPIKNDVSSKVVKWEDYLNRVRSGIKSAPNSPTTSPRSVRGSARLVNNFMLLKMQEGNPKCPPTAPPQPPKQTKLIPLPKPLCKSQKTRKNVQLEKFEEYLNKLNSNLPVTSTRRPQDTPNFSITYVPSDTPQNIVSSVGEKNEGGPVRVTVTPQEPTIQTKLPCKNVRIVKMPKVSNHTIPLSSTRGITTSVINSVSAGTSGSLITTSSFPVEMNLKETSSLLPPVDSNKISRPLGRENQGKAPFITSTRSKTAKPQISVENTKALRNDIETIHNYCTSGARFDPSGAESPITPPHVTPKHPVDVALSSLVAILNAAQLLKSEQASNQSVGSDAKCVVNSFDSPQLKEPVPTTVAQNVVIDGATSPQGSLSQTLGSQDEKYEMEATRLELQSNSVTLEETTKNAPVCSSTKSEVPQVQEEFFDASSVAVPDTSEEVVTATSVAESAPCTEDKKAPSSPARPPPPNSSKNQPTQPQFSMSRSMAAAEMLATDVFDDGVQEVLTYKEPTTPPCKPHSPVVEDPDPAVILLDDAISSLDNDTLLNGTEEIENKPSTPTRLFCKLPSYFMTGKLDTEVARKKSLDSEGGSNEDETVGYNKLPHYLSSGKKVPVPRHDKTKSPGVDRGEPVVKLDPACEKLAASGKEIFYSRLPSYYTYARPHPELRTFNDHVSYKKDDTVTLEQIEMSVKEAEIEASTKRLASKQEKEEDVTGTSQKILFSKLPGYYMRDMGLRGVRRRCDDSDSYSDRDSPRSSHCSRRRARKRRKKSRTRKSHHRNRSRSRSRSRSSSLDRDSPRRSRSRKRGGLKNQRRKSNEQRREQMNHNQAMEERRVVYVGRIARSTTKNELRLKFIRFGNIEAVSLHFREDADNYGFITFQYACDAFRAIEEGNEGRSPQEEFELCFGGRRQFCGTAYQDLDSKVAGNQENKSDEDDFDALLRRARRGLR